MIKDLFTENVKQIHANENANFLDVHDCARQILPPKHSWSGPQPGMLQQTDAQHRYVFSPHTGRIEHVVKYSDNGAPYIRVHFKHTAAEDGHVYPSEVDVWRDGEFFSAGKIERDETQVTPQTSQVPLYMVGQEGEEKEIPHNNPQLFFTPAGTVVLLTHAGSFLRSPKAEYQGRIVNFNPQKPFLMKTVYGLLPLQPERTDVLIDPKGNVHQLTGRGLRCIGELAHDTSSLNALPSDAPPFTAQNNFFTAHMLPAESVTEKKFAFQIEHPSLVRFVNGPLHTIVGKHAFLQPSVPELVDMHGSTAAEEQLRRVERYALELGLVLHTLRNEIQPDARAALLRLQYLMEERLWLHIAELEKMVGMGSHELVHAPSVRVWVERASEDPLAAVSDLRHQATQLYAP